MPFRTVDLPDGLAERPICPDCEGIGWSGLQQINSTKTGTHLEPACESKMSDSRPCAPPFAFGDATPRPGSTFRVRSPRFPVMIEKHLCGGCLCVQC